MSVNTIKQIMRDYREIVNPRNKTVGSVLKHHRVDKGLTLEEVSESSCSVSYLSKVENNKLVPSDKILDKLLKRLGLTTKVFEYEKKDTKYIDEILELGYVPKKLINNAKNKNDYQSKIIKFAYTLLNQEIIEEATKLKNDLLEYYTFFNDDELAFFIYLIMCKLYMLEKYENVVLIHHEINAIYDKITLKMKAEVLALKSLYRLERFGEATNFLKTIIARLYKYNKVLDINKIKQYELSTYVRFNNTDDVTSEIENLKNNPDINFDYVWFNHYFYFKNDYEKAYKYIKKIYEENEHFYIYYIITLDKTNKVDELKRVLDKNLFDNLKASYYLVERFIDVKHFNKHLFDQVKKELLRTDIVTNEFFVIKYIYIELINEHKSKFLYKEAFEILTKLLNQYKKRSSIILYK